MPATSSIRTIALLPILVAASLASPADAGCSDVECEKIRQKISRIQSKMRQGYRVSAGQKMEDELRRLRKLRAKVCR